MAQIGIDTLQIDAAQRQILSTYGQLEWVVARAMTTAAKAAKAEVAKQILPMIQGGPTPWTRRGLIATFASPQNLSTFVGFQHGAGEIGDQGQATFKGGGTPSGRYMELQTSGGDRRPKSTELRLQRAGILRDGQYLVPFSNNKAIKVDARGNVSGAQYTQVLSRLRAMQAAGSGQDAPVGKGSRGRSGRKRGSNDFFLLRGDSSGPTRWQLGSDPLAIVKRDGPGPKGGTGRGTHQRGRPQTVGYKRGYVSAFAVIDQPNYERRLPINRVILDAYHSAFGVAFQKGYEAELAEQRRRGWL